jgi:hypothetical protein
MSIFSSIEGARMARKTPPPLTTTVPVGIVRTQVGKILSRVASHHERIVVTKAEIVAARRARTPKAA